MKLNEIAGKLNLKEFAPPQSGETIVTGGYTSDMLSDVIANSEKDGVWVTIQTHSNVIAVASLKDLAAIVMAGGHEPNAETIELAKKKGVCVLGTPKSAFEITGELFKLI
ncbi:MAG: DRTGG domain-containing protein [bacterium]